MTDFHTLDAGDELDGLVAETYLAEHSEHTS